MRYAGGYELRTPDMTSGEAALQAQALRDSAAALLHEAAQTGDLVLRDALTRQALQQIEAARRLLDETRPILSQPATRLH